jgi:hypothetical protein
VVSSTPDFHAKHNTIVQKARLEWKTRQIVGVEEKHGSTVLMNTGWKAMLLYALASPRWVCQDSLGITLDRPEGNVVYDSSLYPFVANRCFQISAVSPICV